MQKQKISKTHAADVLTSARQDVSQNTTLYSKWPATIPGCQMRRCWPQGLSSLTHFGCMAGFNTQSVRQVVLLGCSHIPLCMQVTVDFYMHKEMRWTLVEHHHVTSKQTFMIHSSGLCQTWMETTAEQTGVSVCILDMLVLLSLLRATLNRLTCASQWWDRI